MIEILLYGASLIGSVSLGYSLLRVGFPKMQGEETKTKLGYGFGIGIMVLLPAMLIGLTLNSQHFVLTLFITYILLFAVLLIKRKLSKETDDIPLVKTKKRKIIIPKKVMTEKEIKNNNDKEEIKEQLQEEIITKKPTRKISSSDPIKIVNPKSVEEQLFKEKEHSVIDTLDDQTKKANISEDLKKRNEALKKLRGLAKQMDDEKDE